MFEIVGLFRQASDDILCPLRVQLVSFASKQFGN
jgi:hypothetical protein